MPTFESLVNGFTIFKATIYPQKKNLITHLLQQGQRPTTLVLTSSELRVSPEDLTSSNPGDLYVVRTPAGLVPPYRSVAQATVAGVSFAVEELEVENIIVLGHARNLCVRKILMMEGDKLHIDNTALEPLARWLSIAMPARDAVRTHLKDLTPTQQEQALEQEIILHSMNNLLGYPGIKERMDKDTLSIYGWHFDIESGEMLCFNPASQQFEPI